MLELVYLMSGLLAYYAYCEARRLGLLEEVPYDDKARERLRAGQLLVLLKSRLSQIELIQWQSDRLVYRRQGEECRLWVHQDNLYFESQNGNEELLHQLGRGRQLKFRREGSQLAVEVISSEDHENCRNFDLRLPLAS